MVGSNPTPGVMSKSQPVRSGDYLLVLAPDEYPGPKYHRGYAYEHHVVWWKNTSELVGDSNVLHHINGDKHDNTFENLEKLSRSEHSKQHADMGRAHVELLCPYCSNTFERRKDKTYLQRPDRNGSFCDKSCAAKFYHNNDGYPDNMVLRTFWR